MKTFEPQLKMLALPQLAMWNELDSTPPVFVLYGGTGLSVQFGHRPSEDFDFFSSYPFDPSELLRAIPYLKDATPIEHAESTLTCFVNRNGRVKISFFGNLSLNRIHDPLLAIDSHLKVASSLDIAGTKMAVIQKRASFKDYLDVHTLVERGISLGQALAAAQAIYGKAFDASISLRALMYYEDGTYRTCRWL